MNPAKYINPEENPEVVQQLEGGRRGVPQVVQ